MLSYEVDLPPGALGLELEPVLTGGNSEHHSRSIGCRVKAWTDCSNHIPQDIKSKLKVGAIITAIDGEPMEAIPFKYAVAKLSASTQRRISFISSETSFSPDELPDKKKIELEDNIKPIGALDDEVESVVAGSDDSNCSSGGGASQQGAAIASTNSKEITNHRKADDRTRDGKLLLLGGKVQTQQAELAKVKSVIAELQSDLDMKTSLVDSLRKDIGCLKKNNRNKEGKIALLSYQLDKVRSRQQSVVGTDGQLSHMVTAEDSRIVHNGKWKQVLDSIKAHNRDISVDDNSGRISTDTDEISLLRRELLVKERVNQRLEAQLRAWALSQIELQKQIAAGEINDTTAKGIDFARSNERRESISVLSDNASLASKDGAWEVSDQSRPQPTTAQPQILRTSPDTAKPTIRQLILEFPEGFVESKSNFNHSANQPLPPRLEMNHKGATEILSPVSTSNLLTSGNLLKHSHIIETALRPSNLTSTRANNRMESIIEKENDMGLKDDNTPIMRKMLNPNKNKTFPPSEYFQSNKLGELRTVQSVDVDESLQSEYSLTSASHISVYPLQEPSDKIPTSTQDVAGIKDIRGRSSKRQEAAAVIVTAASFTCTGVTGGSVQKSSSQDVMMSPTIVKLNSQMNKLRGQNASIRSDLQKFRGIIQRVKKDFEAAKS